MKEYLLTTDKYSESMVLSGSEAYGTLLTRLLLLEPGTNPEHPKMGIGIGPKYRYLTDNQLSILQVKIQDQVNTYLPSEFLTTVKVYLELKPESKYLLITIVADDTKYVFDTENSNTPMELVDVL